MGLSTSTYYRLKGDKVSTMQARDHTMRDLIEIVHSDFPGYGYRRIAKHLKREGICINEKAIRRVMKKFELFPIIWKKFKCSTTQSDHDLRRHPNLVKGVKPGTINEIWVADITYIRISTCFVYLAVILDMFSRKVVGWAFSQTMEATMCVEALKMAIESRNPPKGCIHHSDQGVQYASDAYQEVLLEGGLRPSMSRRGNCYDNAFAETFFKTLKYEEIHLNDYLTFADVLERGPHFIEEVYNKKRLHSSIGYLPPEEFEAIVASETDQPAHIER